MSHNTPAFVHTTVHEFAERLAASDAHMSIGQIAPRLSIAKAMYSLLKLEIATRSIEKTRDCIDSLELGDLIRDTDERYFAILSLLPKSDYYDVRIEIMPDVKSFQIMTAGNYGNEHLGRGRGYHRSMCQRIGTSVDYPQGIIDAFQARAVTEMITWTISNRVHRISVPTAEGSIVQTNDDEEIDTSIIIKEGVTPPTRTIFMAIREAIEMQLQVQNICAGVSYMVKGDGCFTYSLVPSHPCMLPLIVLTDDLVLCIPTVGNFRITDYANVETLAQDIVERLPMEPKEPQQGSSFEITEDEEEEKVPELFTISEITEDEEEEKVPELFTISEIKEDDEEMKVMEPSINSEPECKDSEECKVQSTQLTISIEDAESDEQQITVIADKPNDADDAVQQVEVNSPSPSPASKDAEVQKRLKLSADAAAFVPLAAAPTLSASAATFTPRLQTGTTVVTVAAGVPVLKTISDSVPSTGFITPPSSYMGALQMYNPPFSPMLMHSPAFIPQHYMSYNPYLQAQSMLPFPTMPMQRVQYRR
jgi:hypothetical protein